MNKIKIEIKWAIIFMIMVLLWMLSEKLSGLHSIYIEYHPIYTNLIAIPSFIIYFLALRDKNKNFYLGEMTYKQGLMSGIYMSLIISACSPITQLITSYVINTRIFREYN